MRKKTCSCDNTAALARCEHTWLSLRAQGGMFRQKDCCIITPGAQLDLSPCARRPVHATTPLRSHAGSTIGSLSMRKRTCSCDNTAAFARYEHTWISLRAQENLFRQNDCCLILTPRAHLDPAPWAKRHVPSKRLLRSRAAPKDRWFLLADAGSNFYSQARTPPLRYQEPVTRNPGHRAFALQIANPISV